MVNLDFLNRTIRPIGLDIGHNSIKMIQLAISGEKISVHAAEEAPIDIDANEDEQTRRNRIAETIRQMYTRGYFFNDSANACKGLLPGEKHNFMFAQRRIENHKSAID